MNFEYCILIGDTLETDIDLFFGPITDKDIVLKMDGDIKWPDILVKCGIFKSKTQARKNGWDKDIPEGFTDHFVGKLRKRITILKITKVS